MYAKGEAHRKSLKINVSETNAVYEGFWREANP
jgi:hypothetical protein